jgi:hypothetical protein
MTFVRPPRARWARALRGVVCSVAVLLGACHGSSISPPGTPVVTMAHFSNSKDFASYVVAIDGITFVDKDGNLVTPLVTAETVDLTQVTDFAELVEAPAVPSDTYVSATITIDYSAASIWVNLDGQPVRATLVDPTTGLAPTFYTITITFDPKHPLVVTNGVSNRVLVDVDLTASNLIDTSTSTPTVTVQDFPVISPAPVDATPLRARGVFVVTQPSENNFIMNLRPFYDLASALGAVFVNVNANTYYNINGVSYTGTAGLNAMNTQQVNLPVVAYGTLGNLSGITPYFNANQVYVGTSQESPLAEYVSGVVSARSGSVITVSDATFLTPLGFPYTNNVSLYTGYYASVPVTLADTTVVSSDGVDTANLNSNSISVGQQVLLWGNASMDVNTGLLVSLDASLGQVRLQSTPVWGTVNSATSNSVTLDVLSLANFAPQGFKFAGTGAGGVAVSPDSYLVNTGSQNESALAPGTLVQAQGTVAPFGSAPPAFNASTITPGTSTLQQLVIYWENGGVTKPFSSVSADGLVVDLANSDLGSTHVIRTGPASLDLKSLPASPLITWVGANPNDLVLAIGSSTLTTGISVFNEADEFVSAIGTAFNGTNKIFSLVAYGQYNATTNTFVAARINVAIEEGTTT